MLKANNIKNEDIFNPDIVIKTLCDSADVKKQMASDFEICRLIAKTAEYISESIAKGGKIIICGNGGSASDALHFCGEIVGRFQKERKAAPAISLNADVATMTAIANDYGYETIYERGVEALLKPNDIFIGISTSGNSANVLKATKAANRIGGVTVALLGKDGGKLKSEANISIVVPSNITARIQESHICIIHMICDMVEKTLD